MEQLSFLVAGSAPEPYEVTFIRTSAGMKATCTCLAAAAGTHCKHRVDILLGTSKSISSGNAHDMATAQAWLPGSPIDKALTDVAEAEALLASAKLHLAHSKRRLSAAFLA